MSTECDCVCHKLGYVYCGPGWCAAGHKDQSAGDQP